MSDPEHPLDIPGDSASPGVQPNAAPPESSEAAAAVPDTVHLLRQAELKAQQHHDAWLRAMAEAENVRKRSQVELANAYKYAVESIAAELLPVRDSLEATLAADSATLETLKSGVELTLRQLSAAFDKTNLKEINPVGEKFDPHRHQAISMLPSEKEPNTVINVLQKGYSLHDRVVRPALVTVAKPRDLKA